MALHVFPVQVYIYATPDAVFLDFTCQHMLDLLHDLQCTGAPHAASILL